MVNALVETWRRTIFSPEAFWSSVKPDGKWEDALLYAWLVAALATVIGTIVQAPFLAAGQEQFRRVMEMVTARGNLPPEVQRNVEMILSYVGGGAGYLVIYRAIANILLYPIWLFVVSALVHLFCILFGSATNGYWATFRAMSYASAPYAFFMIQHVPCVGQAIALAALIYTVVLSIWGVMRLQETSGGKAAAAVLATPVLLCCCCCGVSALGVGALKSMISRGG